jgi:uncharacterized protein
MTAAINPLERRYSLLETQPYQLTFVTLSGSHLYGFPSADSDFDLRGVHVTPPNVVLGLDDYRETVEAKTEIDGYEDELVTHDARKYFRLLVKNNGYVLEQIFSPIVLHDGGHLDELRAIAMTCITRRHELHYKGFGYSEWLKFVNSPGIPVKRILYVFRVLMTGIHLMRTGEVEANILRLNEGAKLPYIDDLIAQKKAGLEKGGLVGGHGLDFYTREYRRLEERLKAEADRSSLPLDPTGRPALNDLLLRLRSEAAA